MKQRILLILIGVALSLLTACKRADEAKPPAQKISDTTSTQAQAQPKTSLAPTNSPRGPNLEADTLLQTAPASGFQADPAIHDGEFAVLIGEFNTYERAEDKRRELRERRINAYIFTDPIEANYKVLIGRYATYRQAEHQMKQVKKRGYKEVTIFPIPEAIEEE